MRSIYEDSKNIKHVELNCVKHSGEWYFQQQCYPWPVRVEFKKKYKDVILCPFEDAGILDGIMKTFVEEDVLSVNHKYQTHKTQ